MQYRDEEWRMVGRKRDKYRDRRTTEKHEAIDKVSVSYYITNLPQDIPTREIWNRCASIGTIVDVYVAQKLSKMGRRFGFVRFIKVKDTKEVEKRLCDIWFGNYHVFASVARVKRKESNMNRQDYHVNKKEGKVRMQQDGMRNGRSYAKAVAGEKPKNVEQVQEMRSMIIEKKELTGLTDVSSTILEEVREPTSIPNLMNLCCEEGFSNINIRHVGGLWVWVACENGKVSRKFTTNMGIQQLFKSLRPLSSEFVVNERLVWLEISKLPLCAWNSCVFKKIATLWGEVLFADEDESNSLEIGKVYVKTANMAAIQEPVLVDIEGKKYKEDEHEFNLEQESDCGEYVPNTFNESNKDMIHVEKDTNVGRDSDEKVEGEQDNMSFKENMVHRTDKQQHGDMKQCKKSSFTGFDGDGHNKRNEEDAVEKSGDGNSSEEGGVSHRATKSMGDSSIPPGFGGMKFSPIHSKGSRSSWHSKPERERKAWRGLT
ncbi:RNA-directed DNA polymerase, eukaryota [Tanacetum coccineum]